jgi:dTDP-4-amino-4,6-dideoxygalactose transaminase
LSVLDTPFSPWPSFTDEEADAARAVILSNRVNYWTGKECREFEREFAAWCGAKYAVSLANGTLALDVALKALGIGCGDEVIVTPRTFIASVSCVVNAGAVPVFADVETDSGNISARTIRPLITARTKGIVCVHLAGWPCDMDPIMALAEEHSLKVVEDCAQAHGARYKGRSVGTIGHVGAWSFCQDKIMTTGGEGGMVTTNDRALWSTMWSLKDHGKSWEAVYERQHRPGFRWLHESFGTNWRMLEVQAAIGRIQLRRMAEWTALRNAHARQLAEVCERYPVVRVPEFKCGARCPRSCAARQGCLHAHYRFYAYVRPENLAEGWTRDRIVEEVNRLGVPCYQGSCSEVYLEQAFDDTGWRPAGRLPGAAALGEQSLMFLVHPTLATAEIEKACRVLSSVLERASR